MKRFSMWGDNMSRRVQLKKRKERQLRRNILSLVIFMAAIIAVFTFHGISSYARSSEEPQEYKYYTSCRLEEGDSLMDMAVENYDEKHDTVESYLEEICHINGLTDDTVIYAGMNLIIPYYSTEFK